MKVYSIVLALVFCVVAPASQAGEMYRWVDESGRSHFAQDLHQVPPKYRQQAEEAMEKAEESEQANPVQVLGNAPPIKHRWEEVETPKYRKGVTEVKLKATRGDNYIVYVRINDKKTFPFLLDTGASTVTLTQEMADELGIVVGPNTKRGRFSTANGVIKAPIIDLDSVEVGGASVTHVRASILPKVDTGLLGTSFLKHFQYSIDPVESVLILRARNKDE